jgi:hypothetical protein
VSRGRGLLLAAVQLGLLLAVVGKLSLDRWRLPHGWARVVPVDPDDPFRGRYVALRVIVPDQRRDREPYLARLVVEDGRIVAREAAPGEGVEVTALTDEQPPAVSVDAPLAFFIPEDVADPSRLEGLHADVTVPAHGAPRPIRLGLPHDGRMVPLDLRDDAG